MNQNLVATNRGASPSFKWEELGKNISVSEGRLNYIRSFLLLGAIGLPIWAFFHEFSITGTRLWFGLLCGLIVWGSFKIHWIGKFLPQITYSLIYSSLYVLHNTLINVHLDPIWCIYHIMIFFGLGAAFRDFKWLFGYVALFTLGMVVVVFRVENAMVEPQKFFFIYILSALILAIISFSYTWSIRKVEMYAHHNAHELRGPISRIRGLINLSKMDQNRIDDDISTLIEREVQDLDRITRSSQKILE